jgi:hypothetical protein
MQEQRKEREWRKPAAEKQRDSESAHGKQTEDTRPRKKRSVFETRVFNEVHRR